MRNARPGARPGKGARSPRRPVRLTRRGRIVVVVLLVLVTLAMLWVGSRIAPASAAGHPGREGLPWVRVHQGDTLWEIAEAVTPEGDPAVTVDRIMELNGLSGTLIRPGTRIYLPAGSGS
ncbi:LysM peptidoglycan-binding domain-containing protein [Planobispora siamensis]|uniref:LysM domain-containing protein n=1 Tax=Planobispora siamensis TaxID=936338 RepID=A0A8J3SC25_9ACTN|nr:LysM peptidoglycan-binding domain-containing protein [Planobispora siamensis]GIH90450.1 hypothetical protein Psi01_10800 [Planobispora siamensis]